MPTGAMRTVAMAKDDWNRDVRVISDANDGETTAGNIGYGAASYSHRERDIEEKKLDESRVLYASGGVAKKIKKYYALSWLSCSRVWAKLDG